MPLVATTALTKRYSGRRRALDDLTSTSSPGSSASSAPTAPARARCCGSSSACSPPTSGAATVLGHDVRTRRARRCAGSSATCPSPTACRRTRPRPTSSARWRGCPGCRAAAARERAAEVLRHVGLYEERYRPIGGYSTGMKQRVKLAQALVHDPQLLLLDEPTNGLDPAGRDEMLASCGGPAPSSASPSSWPATCSARSSASATTSSRSMPAGSSGPRRCGVHRADRHAGGRGRGGRRGAGRRARGRRARGDRRRTDGPRRRSTTSGRATSSATPSPSSACRWSASSSAGAASRSCSSDRAGDARPRDGATGSIYDLGYPGYDGPRLGRPAVALGAASADAASGLRDRPRRPGQGRALPAARPVDACRRCSRSGSRRLPRRPGRRLRGAASRASPIRHDTYQSLDLDARHAVLRRPGARAVRARPALRRAAAVLLARADPDRLRAGARPAACSSRSSSSRRAAAHPDASGPSCGAADPVTGLRDESARRSRRTSPCRVLGSAVFAGVAAVVGLDTPRRAYAMAAIIALFIVPPIVVGIIAGPAVPDVAERAAAGEPERRGRWRERGDLRTR